MLWREHEWKLCVNERETGVTMKMQQVEIVEVEEFTWNQHSKAMSSTQER